MLRLNCNNKNDDLIFDFTQINVPILEANTSVPSKRKVLRITGMFFDTLGLI